MAFWVKHNGMATRLGVKIDKHTMTNEKDKTSVPKTKK